MDKKSLINQLELAYAPQTAYEFAIVKDDPSIELALEKASLYVIGQRPVITFENVTLNQDEYRIYFEIHQKGNSNILYGNLPLIQKIVGSTDEDTIHVAFNFLEKQGTSYDLPFNNVHGFSFLQDCGHKKNFLIWFSPEKLLQNWWKDLIDCEIEGDYRSFLKYNVHYVGKATKQSIIKRLIGHATFQDILSLEAPVTEKQLPANEIVILPFEFQDNIQMQSFGPDSDIKSMVSAIRGENYPEKEKIFLDAEKALIKAMKPFYNKELFNNYPKSKDGLYNDNYDAISYTFMDPITLIYREGQIYGGTSIIGGDAIMVINNREFKLIRD